MKAFLNKPSLKAAILKEIRRHQKEDMIIQGQYGPVDCDEKWKGCAVGCTLHSLDIITKKRKDGDNYYGDNFGNDDIEYGDYSRYEKELGIPQELARLEDNIFEALSSKKEYIKWPEQFIQAIPVGADLRNIHYMIGIELFKREVMRSKGYPEFIFDIIKKETIALCDKILAKRTLTQKDSNTLSKTIDWLQDNCSALLYFSLEEKDYLDIADEKELSEILLQQLKNIKQGSSRNGVFKGFY